MGPAAIKTKRIGMHVSRSILGMIGMILNFGAVALPPLAESTSIAFTMPIFATILSAIVLREHIGLHRWSAVVLGFVGVVIMAHPDLQRSRQFRRPCRTRRRVRDRDRRDRLARPQQVRRPLPAIVFWFTTISLPPLGVLALASGTAHNAEQWGLLVLLGVTAARPNCS